MKTKCNRAATPATAPSKSTQALYRGISHHATIINTVLASLLFGLVRTDVTRMDQATVLDANDGPIRLKIDAGVLTGGAAW